MSLRSKRGAFGDGERVTKLGKGGGMTELGQKQQMLFGLLPSWEHLKRSAGTMAPPPAAIFSGRKISRTGS